MMCPRDYSDLMCAIIDFDSEIEILIANGEDPNYEAKSTGQTPLMLACLKYNTDYGLKTILTLLKHGADINKANRYGKRALIDAITQPNYVYVKTLLDHGADIYFSFFPFKDADYVQTPQTLIADPYYVDPEIYSRPSRKEFRRIKRLLKGRTKARSNLLCEIRKEPIPEEELVDEDDWLAFEQNFEKIKQMIQLIREISLKGYFRMKMKKNRDLKVLSEDLSEDDY